MKNDSTPPSSGYSPKTTFPIKKQSSQSTIINHRLSQSVSTPFFRQKSKRGENYSKRRKSALTFNLHLFELFSEKNNGSNKTITHLARLKKVNDNLNNVLLNMKKEIISQREKKFEIPKGNLDIYLNKSIEYSIRTYKDNTIASKRKCDAEKFIDNLELDISITKEDYDSKKKQIELLHCSFKDLTIEEQISLAGYSHNNNEINMHQLLSDLIKSQKEVINLKDEIKNLNQSIEQINHNCSVKLEEMNNEKQQLMAQIEKNESNQNKMNEKIKEIKDSNSKLQRENMYLKDKLAKLIFLKKTSQQKISSHLKGINEIQNKIKIEINS